MHSIGYCQSPPDGAIKRFPIHQILVISKIISEKGSGETNYTYMCIQGIACQFIVNELKSKFSIIAIVTLCMFSFHR